MLEKITNINLKSEFFNGKKAAVAYKNSFKSGLLRNDLHDSVNLSPAYRFLSQIDWRLKEMTKISSEKISVAFYFSGFEFQTTLDLSNLAKLNTLVYHVANEEDNEAKAKVIAASLSVMVNHPLQEPNDVLTELHGIKTLFYRLSSMNLKEELNIKNDILFDLFDGILKTIGKEFDYINSCLFTFVEKMLKIKIPGNMTPTVFIEKDLSNKIKLLNVDVY
ncbi:MAG: hypothetical protein WC209_05815 [Ignavibacteriaceae bacterium]|jgi:hypothetical protein